MKKEDLFPDMDPESLPDNLPPCLIHVDKEGRLWHLGAEMIHQGINRLLMEHIELDEKGRYVISLHGQRCFVEVEDTFFVINRLDYRPAEGKRPEAFLVTLNDEDQEELDISTLIQGKDNVLYAQVKNKRFPARFLRRSYYQLAEHIVEKDGCFFLPCQGHEYPIA